MQERYTIAYLNTFMKKQVTVGEGGGVVGMDPVYFKKVKSILNFEFYYKSESGM